MPPWRNKRNTIDSPNCVGIVDMRMSKRESPDFTVMRPSCGRRRSAMSSCAISFRRTISAEMMRGSASTCTCKTPSMRYLTLKTRS